MGTIRLGVGTEWLLDGRAFRVVRQLGPDQFVTLDVKFNVEQVLSQSDLLNQFTLGSLRFADAADTSTDSTKCDHPTASFALRLLR